MKPQKPVAGFCSKNKTKPSVVEVHVSCLLSSNQKAFAFTNYRSGTARPRWMSSAGQQAPALEKFAIWQQHRLTKTVFSCFKSKAGSKHSTKRAEEGESPLRGRGRTGNALKTRRFQCTFPTLSHSCTNNGSRVCFPPRKVNST